MEMITVAGKVQTSGGKLLISPAVVPTLYFPAAITIGLGMGALPGWLIDPIGSGFTRGLVGPVKYSLSGPDAATFALAGPNGCTLYSFTYGNTQSHFSLTLSATDGITILSRAISITAVTPAIWLVGNFVLDTAPVDNANYGAGTNIVTASGFSSVGIDTNSAHISAPFTKGFDAGYQGNIDTSNALVPTASHLGPYGVTLGATAAGVPITPSATTLWITAELPPVASFAGPQAYTHAQVGDVFGTVTGYSDAGIVSYALTTPGNNLLIANNGNIFVIAPLTAGAGQTATITLTSNSGMTANFYLTFTVLAGVLLPSSAMTLAAAPISNYSPTASSVARIVGTPVVNGMSGPIAWSLQQDHTNADMETDGHTRRYLIDRNTGQISAVVQLIAQTDILTITAQSGPTKCILAYPLVVTAHAGPVIFVGQGMTSTSSAAYQAGVALYGTPGLTFEHWEQCYQAFNGYGDCSSAVAGGHIYVFPNADPDYYANDNGLGSGNYQARFGMAGPATIEGVIIGGKMPRWGGPNGSGGYGGIDMGSKGFLVLNSGDFHIKNLEFSFIHANGYDGAGVPGSGSTGCGIRINGDTYASVTIDGCYFHDCDQGIEGSASTGEITLTNSEIVNCGAVYVGAGATHNMYLGECWKVTLNNVLSHRCFNGHTLKCRAMSSVVSNSRFYDGERGGASNIIDFPNGGNHVVNNCVLQKGPFAQNPNAISFCEDMQSVDFAVNTLLVENSTLINNVPPVFGALAIFMNSRVSTKSGSHSTAAAVGNTYYGWNAGNAVQALPYQTDLGAAIPGATTPVIANTGGVYPAGVQPALDFSHPFPATGNALARPGPFYFPYDGENRNNFVNTYGVQVDPGNDDIHISAAACPVGTIILPAITATGAPYFQANPVQPDIRINPFVAGTVWSLVYDAQTYVMGPLTTAPAGRYLITAAPDGTSATLKVGQALTPNTTDSIIIRAVAPNGTVVQNMAYLVIAA